MTHPDDLAINALIFARGVHAGQRRKYTNEDYVSHCQEVAGIVSTVIQDQRVIAIALLHDTMEDCDVTHSQLADQFGKFVADGVWELSDLEADGNRAARKLASRQRLSKSVGAIQSIKIADLISNTASIARHDPKFAATYLVEKRAMLDVLLRADPRLRRIAMGQLIMAERAIAHSIAPAEMTCQTA